MVYGSVWKKISPASKLRGQPKETIQKILPQSGKIIDYKRDAGRHAKLPGVRISKTGKRYWETRANRTDLPGKRI